MTTDEFQALALRLGAVTTRPILDTIRFEISGRTFATLGWPEKGWAVLQLSQEDQTAAISASRGFMPEPGPRGERGVTLVRLRAVEAEALSEVLAAAWREAYRIQRTGLPRSHEGSRSIADG